MVQPSGRQFSSSQAVICVCRWPRPCGGTPILMRTGKRRSAVVIISRGLPGNLNVPYIFSSRLPRPLGAVQPVESALNRFGRESLFETKLSRRALPAQPSLPANVRQVAPSSDGHVVSTIRYQAEQEGKSGTRLAIGDLRRLASRRTPRTQRTHLRGPQSVTAWPTRMNFPTKCRTANPEEPFSGYPAA